MNTMTLADLKAGRKAKITAIAGAEQQARRLMEMGLTVGVVVEVCCTAPLGDPIAVKVRGYCLSLRKEHAGIIEVQEGA